MDEIEAKVRAHYGLDDSAGQGQEAADNGSKRRKRRISDETGWD